MANPRSDIHAPTTAWHSPNPEAVKTCLNGQPDYLVDQLLEEMAAAWERGERPLAEAYMARHPELVHAPAVALRLIMGEVSLRQRFGQAIEAAELARRFPDWQLDLIPLLASRPAQEAWGAVPMFPEVGETISGFTLVQKLGSGGKGTVFLATQPHLAHRPVVLKVTPIDGQEHLSLARLLHTHIVPLYSMQDVSTRGLRLLCMPYLGGAPLDQLLRSLAPQPLAQRTGRMLLEALDASQAAAAITVPGRGPVRQLLQRTTYGETICWIGVWLAEALQYAHDRGLIHLDIKPSNVLLAADGQPLLLDFHLAREPVAADGPVPSWFGGTPDYMSPEQRALLEKVSRRRPTAVAIDGRSDIYSLGLTLYEALGGMFPWRQPTPHPRLETLNPQVSPGLSDIIHCCLQPDPRDRYPTAAALADDLRRHLHHLPLRHVPNRSWSERWRKWRTRQPHGLVRIGLTAAIVAILLGNGAFALIHRQQRLREAQTALAASQELFARQEYVKARELLLGALPLTGGWLGSSELRGRMLHQLKLDERALNAAVLHERVDRLRLLSSASVQTLPVRELKILAELGRQTWSHRNEILDATAAPLPADHEEQIRLDVLDLALLLSDLEVQLAPAAQRLPAHEEALRYLEDVENRFGPTAVLNLERQRHALALGRTDLAATAERRARQLLPKSSWEHYALGRALLRRDRLDEAARALTLALDLKPEAFWPNFYAGVCAYRRQQPEAALRAFEVCRALEPGRPECHYNRALALSAVGNAEEALRGYDRAIELNPEHGAALLNRALLHLEARRFVAAEADLQRALRCGAEPAIVYFNLAVLALEKKDGGTARERLEEVLRYDPNHAAARALLDKLPSAKGAKESPP